MTTEIASAGCSKLTINIDKHFNPLNHLFCHIFDVCKKNKESITDANEQNKGKELETAFGLVHGKARYQNCAEDYIHLLKNTHNHPVQCLEAEVKYIFFHDGLVLVEEDTETSEEQDGATEGQDKLLQDEALRKPATTPRVLGAKRALDLAKSIEAEKITALKQEQEELNKKENIADEDQARLKKISALLALNTLSDNKVLTFDETVKAAIGHYYQFDKEERATLFNSYFKKDSETVKNIDNQSRQRKRNDTANEKDKLKNALTEEESLNLLEENNKDEEPKTRQKSLSHFAKAYHLEVKPEQLGKEKPLDCTDAVTKISYQQAIEQLADNVDLIDLIELVNSENEGDLNVIFAAAGVNKDLLDHSDNQFKKKLKEFLKKFHVEQEMKKKYGYNINDKVYITGHEKIVDFLVKKDCSKPATADNIAYLAEVKFPSDKLSDGQWHFYQELIKKSIEAEPLGGQKPKLVYLDEDFCNYNKGAINNEDPRLDEMVKYEFHRTLDIKRIANEMKDILRHENCEKLVASLFVSEKTEESDNPFSDLDKNQIKKLDTEFKRLLRNPEQKELTDACINDLLIKDESVISADDLIKYMKVVNTFAPLIRIIEAKAKEAEAKEALTMGNNDDVITVTIDNIELITKKISILHKYQGREGNPTEESKGDEEPKLTIYMQKIKELIPLLDQKKFVAIFEHLKGFDPDEEEKKLFNRVSMEIKSIGQSKSEKEYRLYLQGLVNNKAYKNFRDAIETAAESNIAKNAAVDAKKQERAKNTLKNHIKKTFSRKEYQDFREKLSEKSDADEEHKQMLFCLKQEPPAGHTVYKRDEITDSQMSNANNTKRNQALLSQ